MGSEAHHLVVFSHLQSNFAWIFSSSIVSIFGFV